MKWMIASDIHGSAYWCRRLTGSWEAEHADRLLLLGDLLYHGPRNDLPRDYAPKEVISLLNPLADRIFCVRGNCEAEVDQAVLDFPVLVPEALLDFDGHLVFATHGHLYSEENPPKLHRGDLLLCGHTHVPACVSHDTFTYLNCGSVSIPKEDSPHSYMTYENGVFLWKNAENREIYQECGV